MKFQCVAVTPKAGISKGSNKPYSMIVVDGIFTGDDGVMSTAEVVFFSDNSRAAPVVIPGQIYEPVIKTVVNRDKKLVAVIDAFKPYVAPISRAA